MLKLKLSGSRKLEPTWRVKFRDLETIIQQTTAQQTTVNIITKTKDILPITLFKKYVAGYVEVANRNCLEDFG